MNPELDEYLNKLAAVRDGLDEKVREARGLIKDMERLTKEIDHALLENAEEIVKRVIFAQIEKDMATVSKETNEFLEVAQKRIDKRFDKLYDLYMGKGQKTGYPIETLLIAKGMMDSFINDAAKERGATVFPSGQLPEGFRMRDSQGRRIKKGKEKPPWLA